MRHVMRQAARFEHRARDVACATSGWRTRRWGRRRKRRWRARRESGALSGVCNRGAHDQVTDVEQDADEHGGDAVIPGPPDAPDVAAPDAAGDQIHDGEHDADFGGGDGERIASKLFEIRNATLQKRNEEESKGDDRGGHVEENNAVDGALVGLIGKNQKDVVHIGQQRDGAKQAQNVDSFSLA